MTNTSQWFYYVIALCAVVLATSASYTAFFADRWVPIEGGFLNQRTGIACGGGTCIDAHTGEKFKR